MTKERFSVSMDDDLVRWLDKMVDEKIFSSRSHALEFCVKQFSNYGIENIVMIHWGKNKKEPLFLDNTDIEIVNGVMKEHSYSTFEEAVSEILHVGAQNIIKKDMPE